MNQLAVDLEIYTYDIDAAGHVNNAVYIHWLEIGRLKLLEAIGRPAAELHRQGLAFVLTQTTITYKAPLHLGDRVRLELWLSELGGATVGLQFRIGAAERFLAAEASQTGALVALTTGRPQRLPPEVRAALGAYLAPRAG